jgi:hypothetical protein
MLCFYIRAELSSQGSLTESARVQNYKNRDMGKNKQQIVKKLNKLRLLKFKYKFPNISIELQTVLSSEAHPAEGQ